MIELDAEKIMSLPQKIKAVNIVNCGFISNELFQNINRVFNVPAAVKILNKIRSGDNSNKFEISIGETPAPKNKKTPQKNSDKIKAEMRLTEDKIRAKLRDFARTVPSFIMAYGDEFLTLANFDSYIDDKTFEEVTGITLADFGILRDEYNLIDETVFNLAVKEFLARMENLSNFFDDNDKDIFDFIPPQKTSQIFTPRSIVQKMVDALEIENPNIFDNPAQKFFDPYMKSGLYIAEIVKRLYKNKNICAAFPNDEKRLKHILENQIYGCAPNEIIFRIATRYIFGNFKNISRRNFFKVDTLQEIQAVTLKNLLQKIFSVKVIILNKDRVKKFGEVFTPPEIVNLMLDDENLADVFETLDTKILEPTAGDGIFLVGILERKLKLAKNSADAFTALSSIYGIEIQFDNLAYARKNVADTFTAFHENNFGDFDKNAMWQILFKNIVQGDATEFFKNIKDLFGESLFEDLNSAAELENVVVIGNPPYQADVKGDNKTYAAPVYHLFLQSFWDACNRVMMIHPARCLFNAGATPKKFMKDLLNDEHLKVIHYEPRSQNIFPDADIKGGVAVTYRDENKFFGKIEIFIPFSELKSVYEKVVENENFSPLSEIMYPAEIYHFTEKMHADFPNAKNILSKGHAYDLKSNVFLNLPEIFFDEKPNDGKEYIQLIGVKKNNRVIKFVRRDYITDHETLEKYKVLIPDSNGSGMINEKLSTPLVGLPLVGSTQTFITLGAFDTEAQAQNCLKYVKTKFARALLGVLKVTQHNPPATWKYVPLQDFTDDSDIDWARSIAEIDKQLYQKYNLSAEEISFIETKIRAMD